MLELDADQPLPHHWLAVKPHAPPPERTSIDLFVCSKADMRLSTKNGLSRAMIQASVALTTASPAMLLRHWFEPSHEIAFDLGLQWSEQRLVPGAT